MKHEQEDCVRKVQASKLAVEGWSRKRDLGSGNPRPQRSGADGEAHCDPSCRIDLEGPRLANSRSKVDGKSLESGKL